MNKERFAQTSINLHPVVSLHESKFWCVSNNVPRAQTSVILRLLNGTWDGEQVYELEAMADWTGKWSGLSTPTENGVLSGVPKVPNEVTWVSFGA